MIDRKRLIKLLESALDVLTDASEEEVEGFDESYHREKGYDLSEGILIEFGMEGEVTIGYEDGETVVPSEILTSIPRLMTSQELGTDQEKARGESENEHDIWDVECGTVALAVVWDTGTLDVVRYNAYSEETAIGSPGYNFDAHVVWKETVECTEEERIEELLKILVKHII